MTGIGDRPCWGRTEFLSRAGPQEGAAGRRRITDREARFGNSISGQLTAIGPIGPQYTRPRTGGWHDSDQRHGLEQATDSIINDYEERRLARTAPARDPCRSYSPWAWLPWRRRWPPVPRRATRNQAPKHRTPKSGTSPSKSTKTPTHDDAVPGGRTGYHEHHADDGHRTRESEHPAVHGLRPSLDGRRWAAVDRRRWLDHGDAAPRSPRRRAVGSKEALQ